jgi:uncharacterized protein
VRFLRVLVALVSLGALTASLSPARAGTRLALVMGNSRYQTVAALDNPSNDAADLAQALRSVGFDVIEQRDATRDVMAKAVRDFSERLRGADIALFFYAGHGLQMNGENYLLPVDARIETAADVRFNTINLTDIQQEMEQSGGGRANIIILDACRNNPFADKIARGRGVTSRGLGRIDATGEGSLIVYSTQPDNVALDGAGRNSPFTSALIRHITAPGLEVRQMLSRVRGDVLEATNHNQRPWDSSSLVGDVYLAGTPAVAAAAPAPPPPQPVVAAIQPPPPPPVLSSPRTDTLPEVVHECDRLTAPAKAGEMAATDWKHTVDVCEAAVAAMPHEPHFQFALGKAYFYTKNYVEGVRHLTMAGDAVPEALNALGFCFENGLGVVKSDQRAFELYSRAAAEGSPVGMANVAGTYVHGTFVKQDFSKALDWYEKSIEAGNEASLQAIGNMYFNGQGVPKDYQTAANYFQQAVDLDNVYSMRFLANMYEAGLLGPTNPQKASELRARAHQLDPTASQQPESITFFRKIAAANDARRQQVRAAPAHRYVVYRRIRLIGGCNWVWC